MPAYTCHGVMLLVGLANTIVWADFELASLLDDASTVEQLRKRVAELEKELALKSRPVPKLRPLFPTVIDPMKTTECYADAAVLSKYAIVTVCVYNNASDKDYVGMVADAGVRLDKSGSDVPRIALVGNLSPADRSRLEPHWCLIDYTLAMPALRSAFTPVNDRNTAYEQKRRYPAPPWPSTRNLKYKPFEIPAPYAARAVQWRTDGPATILKFWYHT